MSMNEWQTWRREVFGDPYLVHHNGPDFAGLLTAVRADPRRVERMLRAGLTAGDPLAARALMELAAAGRAPADAVSYLRGALGGATGEMRIRVAEALYALTGDPSWARPIVGVLSAAASEFARLDAAIALARFPPTSALVAALTRAVRDPEYLVRYHAATTLLRYAGDRRPPENVPHLFDRLTASAEDQWRSAAEELAGRFNGS
ncbi:HEAT repeat domain-containing protein [Actinoplanes sp. NPDC049596]|uniref:HEAT repeat domain-containing protein n=1 Tax=unclassified Actinoplanes TaxID=2626549 RepID=UPI003448041C